MIVKKYDVLREKARILRENGFSLPDICLRLDVSKSTAWYWIRDVEVKKPNAFLERTKRKHKKAARRAAEAQRRKRKKKHAEHILEAKLLWDNGLKHDERFKLFLMLYMAEGIKKDTGSYGITNTDADIIAFAHQMIQSINVNNCTTRLDVYLTEQFDPEIASAFWQNKLQTKDQVHIHERKMYADLSGRNWVSKYGIMRIRVYDTYVKTRIDVWIDLFVREVLRKSKSKAMPG